MNQESWKVETEDAAAARQPPQGPIPCAANCGFFGTADTMGLCSKCYKDFLKTKSSSSSLPTSAATVKQLVLADTTETVATLSNPELASSSTSSSSSSPIPLPSSQSPPRPKAPIRCFSCRKRIGVMGFDCRCGHVFCSLHRYSDKHECSFDYKVAGQEAISKANPVVKADKIDRI